ncbi:hypothetical protein PMAYCL1PPCAC_09893, partial [Pristionchus mayeri]
ENQEFLTSRGFIHRDIAARNIMVDQQERCKVGDFGLSRAVGLDHENYHSQGRKLPLKWMAPESLANYCFSTQTDVWSFGILLFEILTLGGTPYADWPATELFDRLKGGERMVKPDNCSDQLYDIMLKCWSDNPSDRPSFTVLRKDLAELLEDAQRGDHDYYLKLDAQAHYYTLET